MPRARGVIARAYGSTAARLVVLAFVVYNANLRPITSADTFPTRYLPISILREGDFDLDEFRFLRDSAHVANYGWFDVPYYLSYRRGHYVSTYPVAPAVLATPVYVVPVALGLTAERPLGNGFTQTEVVGTFLAKVAASLAVALSVGMVYLALLRVTTSRAALVIALVYAFATSSWSVSSQGLWQNSLSQPLLAAALLALLKAREDERYAALAGVPLALSVACRPTAIIFAAVLFLYVLLAYRRQVVRFLAFPAVVAALLAAYNQYYFGSPVGGYSVMEGRSMTGWFGGDSLGGLLGLLVSPSRGILACSPVLLFAGVGIAKAASRPRDPLIIAYSVAGALTIALYSFYRDWHGGFSYSYRFLVDLLPGLCLAIGLAWPWISARRWRLSAFAAAAAFSAFVQVVGTFHYPCGWYETPVHVQDRRERFWSVRDAELVRCLRAGPVYPDALRLVGRIAGGPDADAPSP